MKNIFPNSTLLTTQSNVARPIPLQMQAVVEIAFGVYKKIFAIAWVSLSGYRLLSPEDELPQPLICP